MIPAVRTKACVYCLGSGALRPDQILLRRTRFYLCAPRGQLIEGYLAIAPYACVGSLSRLRQEDFAELADLRATCAGFYREMYGVTAPLFYEQGRGGGGTTIDPDGRFPVHAHLCALPLQVHLHAFLAERYVARAVNGPLELARVVGSQPYIYVESAEAGRAHRRVYVGRTGADRQELERSRLKPAIAGLMGLPERGDWRSYPGDAELERLIERFRSWLRSSAEPAAVTVRTQ